MFGLTIEVSWLKRSEEEHVQKEQALRRARDEQDCRVQERTAELERRTAEVVQQAQLLDLANDAIFVRGADDLVSDWNKGAERLYGGLGARRLATQRTICCTRYLQYPFQK